MADPIYKKEYRERHRLNNRINFVGRLISTIKYRCNRDGIPFDLTKDDVIIPDVCPKTGIKLIIHTEPGKFPDTPSVDRIDPKGGYVKGNIQIVSFWYNIAKLNWPEGVFIDMCKKVVEHGRIS